jgi:hypothetical protein
MVVTGVGTLSNLSSCPTLTGASYGQAPGEAICLVIQTFDCGVNPANPIYYAITDNHVVVKIGATASIKENSND